MSSSKPIDRNPQPSLPARLLAILIAGGPFKRQPISRRRLNRLGIACNPSVPIGPKRSPTVFELDLGDGNPERFEARSLREAVCAMEATCKLRLEPWLRDGLRKLLRPVEWA